MHSEDMKNETAPQPRTRIVSQDEILAFRADQASKAAPFGVCLADRALGRKADPFVWANLLDHQREELRKLGQIGAARRIADWLREHPPAPAATVRGLSIPQGLAEKIRDEAQVLAEVYPSSDAVGWGDLVAWCVGNASPSGEAVAAGVIYGAALALDMTPGELLSFCGATWSDS